MFDTKNLVCIRGGRMTKFKGKVASFAPSVGASRSPITASVSKFAAAAAFFVVPMTLPPALVGNTDRALANDECGAVGAQTSITCDSKNYAGGGTYPDYPGGIAYVLPSTSASGFKLYITDPKTSVSDGNQAAVEARTDGSGDVAVILNNGSIASATKDGIQSSVRNQNSTATAYMEMNGGKVSAPIRGVYVQNYGLGDAVFRITNGTIRGGEEAAGAYIQNAQSTGNAIAYVDGGNISADDPIKGYGVRTGQNGLGDAIINMTGGSVYGRFIGLESIIWNQQSNAKTQVTLEGGEVTSDVIGLRSSQNGLGDSIANVTGGTIKAKSLGAGAYIRNSSNRSDAVMTMEGGRVDVTSGRGISAYTDGTGNAIVHLRDGVVTVDSGTAIDAEVNNPAPTGAAIVLMEGGEATSLGNNGDGIRATNLGGKYDVDLTGGKVKGGSGLGAAIHTLAAAGGTIDIGEAAIVDGSASGIAIRDGDRSGVDNKGPRDGVDEVGGDAVVTTAGTVIGDAILGLGNDTFNLVGGVYTGDIYGDDKVASANDGNDRFNWTGGELNSGFYGQNGSDTAVVSAADYDGHQILDGGDDVSVADGWIDRLTLAGKTVTAPGTNIINWEIVTLDQSNLTVSDGALTVGSDPNTGLFLTKGSTLEGSNAFALTGNMVIDGTSTFVATGGGAGVYSISGDLTNAGLVTTQDGAVGDVLTVGNYKGQNGEFRLDTYLGAGGSASDLLHVKGDTSGSSGLRVVNAGGPGAQTTSDGIKVVQVDGASNGLFSLLGDYVLEGQQAVVAGAYGYTLHKNGINDPTDGDWYLRSQLVDPVKPGIPGRPVEPKGPVEPIYQPGVPLYESYPQTLLALNGIPTLQQRVGNRYWRETAAREPQKIFCKDPAQNFRCLVTDEQASYYEGNGSQMIMGGNSIWGRIEGAHGRFNQAVSTSGTDYDYDLYKLQAGLDGQLFEDESGKLIGGITVHYGSIQTNAQSFYGTGSVDTKGYGLGANLTWYGTNGFYLDAQGQATFYDSDLYSDFLRRGVTSGNNGFGYALSFEVGQRLALSGGWALTPQAQLIYSSVDFDSFTDPYGTRVSLDDGDSLRGRLGLALENQSSWVDEKGQTKRLNVYGIANLYNEFLDGTRVNVSGVEFASQNERLWGGIGIGGSYTWSENKYSIYGEVSANSSLKHFGDSYTLGGTAGLRVKW